MDVVFGEGLDRFNGWPLRLVGVTTGRVATRAACGEDDGEIDLTKL
jgi:hypothetical protein